MPERVPASVPQITPPSALVSKAWVQDGRAKFRPPAVILIPPPKVEVPVMSLAFKTPPVKESPSAEARPPVEAESPAAVRDEVAVPKPWK